MKDWYLNFEKIVLENTKECKESDLDFFRVGEYLRNAERINRMASTCPACHALRDQIDEEAHNIKKAIEMPGVERRKTDQIQNELIEHLKKDHGFYPKLYHTYMQSIYWLMGFSVVAFAFAKFFPTTPSIVFYSPAFILGVGIGNLRGRKKDKTIELNNKQL
ncbi:MAG: hypothetical protein ACK5IJ_11805 [Mangrovibacterium sp.]